MFILRLLGVLAALAVAGGILGFFLTRQQRYLAFAWSVFRFAVVVALIIFGLLILERVAAIPL